MRRNNIGFCLPQQNADNAASAIAETAEIQKKLDDQLKQISIKFPDPSGFVFVQNWRIPSGKLT